MSDQAVVALDLPVAPAASPALHVRVRHGFRKPANWLQLARFAFVGGSGYVVNIGIFATLVHVLGAGHRLAALAGFLTALCNNFVWHRIWTFAARDGHAGFQAVRFLVVSCAAFVVALATLEVLVTLSVPAMFAQAASLAVAAPLCFVFNKLWSFAG